MPLSLEDRMLGNFSAKDFPVTAEWYNRDCRTWNDFFQLRHDLACKTWDDFFKLNLLQCWSNLGRALVQVGPDELSNLDPINLPQPIVGYRWETDEEYRKRLQITFK